MATQGFVLQALSSPPASALRSDFHIAQWHIQPRLNRISGAGRTRQVEPKMMQVLLYLADHSGDVVSREKLLDSVWPDVVVGEEVVSRSISELRKVFGDDPKSPEIIETISKAGYRLIAPVSFEETIGDIIPEPVLSVNSYETPEPHRLRSKGRKITAIIASVLLLVCLAVLYLPRQDYTEAPVFIARTIPLTTFSDYEFAPALSPDGRQAAFIWTGGAQSGPLNVYVKIVGAGEPLQLTDSPLYEWSPTWSPDGTQIAFGRSFGGIFAVPALGGEPTKLADIGSESRPQLDWSPTGDLIAFSDRDGAQDAYRIKLLSIETGEIQVLTAPPSTFSGDRSPAFSPDGSRVAFIRETDNASDLYVMSAGGGSPVRLTGDNVNIAGITWTPDGNHLVFSSNRGGPYGLWRVAASGGQPEPVSLSAAGDLVEPHLRGDALAYTQTYTDVNIWRLSLADTGSSAAPAAWIASTRWDADPQYAPDGERLAFASSRSGYPEIWGSDPDGARALQLTRFEGPHTGHPRWSPDGRTLAFDTRVNGQADIYVVDALGGESRRLTTSASNDLLPSWSVDGAWVYFTSNRSGRWQIWKQRAEGGEATQVTRGGGFAAFESPDGSALYYSRRDTCGIWKASLADGSETLVIEHLATEDWGHWGITSLGIYYVHAAEEPPAIHRFDFETGSSVAVAMLVKRPIWNRSGLAIDPGGTVVLVTQTDQSHSDLVVSAYSH